MKSRYSRNHSKNKVNDISASLASTQKGINIEIFNVSKKHVMNMNNIEIDIRLKKRYWE
jgi:hypothetical protein